MYGSFKKGPIVPSTQPSKVFVPREANTYQDVTYNFEVETTSEIRFYCESHSVITDINGDRYVDVADLTAVASNYGKRVSRGYEDTIVVCDMDVDFWITHNDFQLLMLDFGRTIPP